MANNEYHQIAQEILTGGGSGGAPGPKQQTEQPAIDIVQEEMRKENPEGEGGDAWYAEAVERAAQLIGLENIATMSVEELSVQLGVNFEQDVAQEIDNIQNPEERLNAILSYANGSEISMEQAPVDDPDYDNREDETME